MGIGKRIIVVGTTGSGKTTLAASISNVLDIPHIELDSLYWEANWTGTPDHIFVEKIQNALSEAGESWVMDGNYRRSRPITWPHTDTIIWLDYPLRIILWRLTWRTFSRYFMRTELWNGNKENLWEHFFTDKSLYLWAFKTYHQRKKTYTELIQSNEYPNLKFLRFSHPRETEKWLKSFEVVQ